MWQSGPKSRRDYKVMINGEPEPLAFRADVHEGWADCYVDFGSTYRVEENGLGQTKIRRIYGAIELLRSPLK